MKKYILINPTIINGIQYYQIKALIDVNKRIKKDAVGGFINNETCLSHSGECWIDKGSIVTNSAVTDDAHIYSNCQIINSSISDRVSIGFNSTIVNSVLSSHYKGRGIVDNNTIIENKDLMFRGVLDNKIVNTKYWKIYKKNNITVFCGEKYCKTGCITLSYQEAWYMLNHTEKWNKYYDEAPDHVVPLLKSYNLKWLKEICLQELKRLNIKIEEGL